MPAWTFQGRTFKNPQDYVGFVYIIVSKVDLKKYIGLKLFTKAGYKQVKGKRKKIRLPSDWKDYFGSNETLQADVKKFGRAAFTREILRLCKSKSECKYYEALAILSSGALLNDDYYNEWLSIKITRRHCVSFSHE